MPRTVCKSIDDDDRISKCGLVWQTGRLAVEVIPALMNSPLLGTCDARTRIDRRCWRGISKLY